MVIGCGARRDTVHPYVQFHDSTGTGKLMLLNLNLASDVTRCVLIIAGSVAVFFFFFTFSSIFSISFSSSFTVPVSVPASPSGSATVSVSGPLQFQRQHHSNFNISFSFYMRTRSAAINAVEGTVRELHGALSRKPDMRAGRGKESTPAGVRPATGGDTCRGSHLCQVPPDCGDDVRSVLIGCECAVATAATE